MEFGNNFDREPNRESDELMELAGFSETEKMVGLRERVVQALKNESEELAALAGEYRDLAEAAIEESDTGHRVEIGLMIAMARMWKEAGNIEQYQEDMWQAAYSAEQAGYTDLVEAIEKEANDVEVSIDWASVADQLDLLQEEANPPMGVSVVRAVAVLLRRGLIEEAKQVALVDGDKLEQYPQIKAFLIKVGLWGRSI